MTPEEKYQMLREQVISKIHWGARDQEVSEWLEQSRGIVGGEADRLLGDAHRRRRQAIRHRALIRLVCSIVTMALVAAFFYVRFFSGAIFVSVRSFVAALIAIGVGAYSVAIFFRSVARLLTGQVPGSVD